MRSDYHRELDALRADLGRMCELAGTAVAHATTVLLEEDEDAAALLAADVDRLRVLDAAVQRRVVSILALQSPVARELREVVTAIQIAADADRMGGLAAHVGRLPEHRGSERVVPDELRPVFTRMGALAVSLADRCRIAVQGESAETHRILDDDQTMEDLHRGIHRMVTSDRWPHGTAVATDVVLLGRFYGRFADHAGEIARRVRFRSTGLSPRGDALV